MVVNADVTTSAPPSCNNNTVQNPEEHINTYSQEEYNDGITNSQLLQETEALSQEAHASFSGVEQNGGANAQIEGSLSALAETEAVLEEIELNGSTHVPKTRGRLAATKCLLERRLSDSGPSKEVRNHASIHTVDKKDIRTQAHRQAIKRCQGKAQAARNQITTDNIKHLSEDIKSALLPKINGCSPSNTHTGWKRSHMR